MKNRLSIKLCQKKNLLREKNTMSWENILASLTYGRGKIQLTHTKLKLELKLAPNRTSN